MRLAALWSVLVLRALKLPVEFFKAGDVDGARDRSEERDPLDIGAGDQGHMFGYATDETESYMPLTHVLSSNLAQSLSKARKSGELPWLRPDGKPKLLLSTKWSDLVSDASHKEFIQL